MEKHDGEVNPSQHRQMTDVKLIDPSLPKEEQVVFTFGEFMQKKTQSREAGHDTVVIGHGIELTDHPNKFTADAAELSDGQVRSRALRSPTES